MIDFIEKLYIGINLFLAGYYFANNYKWQQTIFERLACIGWCIGTMLFGLPYVIIIFLFVICSSAYEKLNGIFQISFWFTFYLTKKWSNLEKEKLEMINRISIKKSKTTLQGRIYMYCTGLINKRNNYIYVELPEELF